LRIEDSGGQRNIVRLAALYRAGLPSATAGVDDSAWRAMCRTETSLPIRTRRTMTDPSAPRQTLAALLARPLTERVLMALILINAVTLGLETSDAVMASFGPLLHAIDRAILSVFVVEIAARLFVYRFAFFRDPWSVFDFVIVAIALIPTTGSLSVLRALRVLRILRLVTILPSLKRVVGALIGALPGMGSIALLLLLFLYVGAVMTTKLFGASFPDKFGTLGASTYTLVQLMTLDGWSAEIVGPVMETYPLAWLFFLPFVLATAFTVLNLFIGIVVNAMQVEHEKDKQEEEAAERAAEAASQAALLAEIRALRADVAALRAGAP
jgi:voltage-gated sodium channel